jgi:ATP synthase protein I
LTVAAGKSYTHPASLDAGTMNAKPRILSRPIRTVLLWQLLATAAMVLVAAALAGAHGAISAALGGLVSVGAGLAAAAAAVGGKAGSAGGILVVALRAEGIKIGLAMILLWLVFWLYRDVVAVAFIGAFLATMLIFAMAFFVRDTGTD